MNTDDIVMILKFINIPCHWQNVPSVSGFVAILFLTGLTDVSAADPWPDNWSATARRHEIDPALLYATALSASLKRVGGQLTPWPWTLRVDGTVHHYQTRGDAERTLQQLAGKPTDLRIGMMGIALTQIKTPAAYLDPAVNLEHGATLLAAALASPDPSAALARLLGDPDGGERVLNLAATLNEHRYRGHGLKPVADRQGALRYAACTPPKKRHVAVLVESAAKRHGVDPAFALAIARRESAFRQSALSPKGARGVMQLMPGTAKRYGANPRILEENIDGGVRYLRDLAEMFGGDPRLVAAGYNAGEHAVIKHGHRVPPYRETQTYVPLVLKAREQYAKCTR